jgi:glutamyl-tRNA reductase
MNVIVLGISHHKSTLELREKLVFQPGELATILPLFKKLSQLDEIVILSTCNRLEIYASTSQAMSHSIYKIKKALAEIKNISSADFANDLYIHHGPGTVKHLFRVVAGLDSMIIGETQILGQVKDAYEAAMNADCTRTMLNELFQRAFAVAKEIRTNTRITRGAVSVSSAAVNLADKLLNGLENKSGLIIGAGETSELTMKHLQKQGMKKLYIANRSPENAEQLAKKFEGTVVPLAELSKCISKVDMVISSTSSSEYILRYKDLYELLTVNRKKTLFILDIAVPRDVDPEIGKIPRVYLYNIDDINRVIQDNLRLRTAELEKCEKIIEIEYLKFLNWYMTLSIAPVIQGLSDKINNICQCEINRAIKQNQQLDEAQQKVLQRIAKRIPGQILHSPIANLKKAVERGNGYYYAKSLKDLFELDINEDNHHSREDSVS